MVTAHSLCHMGCYSRYRHSICKVPGRPARGLVQQFPCRLPYRLSSTRARTTRLLDTPTSTSGHPYTMANSENSRPIYPKVPEFSLSTFSVSCPSIIYRILRAKLTELPEQRFHCQGLHRGTHRVKRSCKSSLWDWE